MNVVASFGRLFLIQLIILTLGHSLALAESSSEYAEVEKRYTKWYVYIKVNEDYTNKAIAVIDFGGTVSATAGDLTIEFPTADASNAVIRIA